MEIESVDRYSPILSFLSCTIKPNSPQNIFISSCAVLDHFIVLGDLCILFVVKI
jgi:hypothetical protein